jgi:hypothetical protein
MSRLREEVCFQTFTPSCFPSPREGQQKSKCVVVLSVMWFVFHSSLLEGDWSGKQLYEYSKQTGSFQIHPATLLTKTGWLVEIKWLKGKWLFSCLQRSVWWNTV